MQCACECNSIAALFLEAMKEFAQRVADLRQENGWSRARLAQEIGVDPSTVNRWESGESAPRQSAVIALAGKAGVNAVWLETGKGPKYIHATVDEAIEAGFYRGVNVSEDDDAGVANTKLLTLGEESLAYNAELVRVRVIEAGAGPGRTNGSEPRFEVFSRDYLERIDKSHSEKLVVGTVVGNSMVPAFSPGSRFFYRPLEHIIGSGSYVISFDGEEVLKDITMLSGGALVIGSRNKDYPSETLIPTEEDGHYRSELTQLVVQLRVVGKVVGVVTLE